MATDKVQRLVEVLDLVLVRSSAGVRLSDIAQELQSPLSSTHDLLRSMTKAGLVAVDAERNYRIGPRFVQLALATGDSLDIRVLAHAHLEQLAAELNHDVYLAIRVDHAVTYVDRIPGRGRAAVDIRLGDPVPLHTSAAGKLYCAFSENLETIVLSGDLPALTSRSITSTIKFKPQLRLIRERGYAISNEETITGIVGFAVPVWAAPGRLVAAVHVSAFRDLISDADVPKIISTMQNCSHNIVRAMGLQKSGDLAPDRPASVPESAPA